MPTIAPKFKFEYFPRGANYSAKSDFQRFTTVDYNMESYVGISGVGVINGWTIEETSGLEVQVLPGKGIINGFFAESPYLLKQRSEMVSGDREVDVIRINSTPEDDMTAAEEATYISVVQEYDPSFSPDSPIENAYVRVVVPEIITVSNNSDTYIFVTRKFTDFYPALDDYPPYLISEPVIEDYELFAAYLLAKAAYDTQMDAIYSYEWRDDPDNHFTEVEFNTTGTFLSNPSRVLLGKITARDGVVTNIDTSDVDSLEKLYSTIHRYADQVIAAHHHGGTNDFDPPRINLETDIRGCTLSTYNSSTQRGIFNVTESQLTSETDGHRHTVTVDSNGDGQTIGIIGSSSNHFHKISESTIGTQEFTSQTISDHIHEIPDLTNYTWDENSQFVVYVNGIPVGDETSTNIEANSSNKTVTLEGIIGGVSKTYGVNFEHLGVDYSFSSQENSVYRFMLRMILDFNTTFQATNLTDNPFLFIDEDGGIAGLADVQSQSDTAEALLRDVGDIFTFTPEAAKNIDVTLLEYQKTEGLESDRVQIEILGNSEVTGILRPESIFFVNAQKFTTGIFEIEQIPFISHVGRIDEQLLPLQYPMVSSDGVQFNVTPAITGVTSDHYHNLILSNELSGISDNTLLSDDPIYYAEGLTGDSYLIAHTHGVQAGTVLDATSTGLLAWQNDINGTALTDSAHTHSIIEPVAGDVKVVYSMVEDRNGNLYVGTSDDLLMIPSDDAVLFVINGLRFYQTGTDLTDMFYEAKENYETTVGEPLNIDSEFYEIQLAIADLALVNDGDSYLVVGKSTTEGDADITMLQKVTSIPVPNFRSIETRKLFEVDPEELITDIVLVDLASGNILDPTLESVQTQLAENPTSIEARAVAQRCFDVIPIISLQIQEVTENGRENDDILVVGGDIVATNRNLQDNLYTDWSSPLTPANVGVTTKAAKDDAGNVWVASNNGVLVLREQNKNNVFSITKRPGLNPDIKDILVHNSENVYCVSDGIFKTEDQGKTWTKKLDGSFVQIIQDYTLMTTQKVGGHTHDIDVTINGNGTLLESSGHTHEVINWVVQDSAGHTHDFILRMYAREKNGIIYRSIDNGEAWTQLTTLPSDENGNLFAYFGTLFVAKPDGLYKLSSGWTKINDNIVYSFNPSYDLSEFFIGTVNNVYSTDDGSTFSSVYAFSGFPMPILQLDSVNKYFGYAYSNRAQKFYLNDLTVTDQDVSALINFDRWFADNGSWDDTVPYDIYINSKFVLSTKNNVDNTERYGWNFDVIPAIGSLDFSGKAELTSELNVFDSLIEVDNSGDFQIGDRILIQSTDDIGEQPVGDPVAIQASLQEFFAKKIIIQNMYYYATVTLVTDTTISFDVRSSKTITLPASVVKIPNLEGDSDVRMSIYDSFLINIGAFTHEELEDRLSYESDQRPYELNNAFLSNLLQLTQAVRYVYPEIDSEMIQTIFYDFHYSEDPLDDNYVGNYVDLLNSETYSQVNFQSPFSAKQAFSINKILSGTGSFTGNIFVGTDVGVFWGKSTDSLEANWFYSFGLPFSVYDMQVFGEETLFLATSQGVYITTDMETFSLQNQEAISFPAFSMGLRWPDRETVVIPSHTAKMVNDTEDPVLGTIFADGVSYESLTPYRSIKITIGSDPSNDKNGSYIVEYVSPKIIKVSPPFESGLETLTDVTITVGAWWQQFDGEDNTSNVSLTNTLLVGGQNKIAYSPFLGNFVWTEASFDSDISDINVVSFLSLTSGSILASGVSNNRESVVNHLLRSTEIGNNWSSLMTFPEIRGTVQSSKLSTYGNSELTITFISPSDLRPSDGEYDKRQISLFRSGDTTAFFNGRVIWNSGFNSTITIFGEEANSLFQNNPASVSFEMYPIIINDMVETKTSNILFGTDIGMYEDFQSTIKHIPIGGTVWTVGNPGRVNKIDKDGIIKSVSSSSTSGNAIISISSDDSISANEFQGKTLYVTDLNAVEAYEIVSHGSKTIAGEITIELNTLFIAKWQTYVGKRIVLVGDESVIHIDFDLNVLNNQFSGGKLYVASSENNNIGTTYDVTASSLTTATVSNGIVPQSTLSVDPTNTSLIAGQEIILIDSTNQIELGVTFNQPVIDNFLSDFSFTIIDVISEGATINGMQVYQNSGNKIVLRDFTSLVSEDNSAYGLIIQPNDAFQVDGQIFQPLPSFNNKKTSTNSDHYHDTNLVGGVVSGVLDSFVDIASNSVEFAVSDTTLFDSAIVQQDGSLFKGGRIRFFNPQKIGVDYFTEIIEHSGTTITVSFLDSTNWNFVEYNQTKISETWNWEIDATNYGYTEGIFYDDFIAISQFVTEDISTGDDEVLVEDTTGILAGDKILIVSGAEKSEINNVDSVLSLTELKLDTPTSNAYFTSNVVQVKVLRDDFTNTHQHMIRNNEIENLSISEYQDLGYPAQHSHRNIALLDVVSDIEENDTDIIAGGSSSTIYNTTNSGSTWNGIVDLNEFSEGDIEINGVSSLEINSDLIVAGTTSGEIFAQIGGTLSIIPLQQPSTS